MNRAIFSPRLNYRADIDGLRAIAVLAVVLYHLHSAWLPGGFIGVDIFFVISGFVVASALSQNQIGSFGQFITQFYARRLARIIPALVLVITVSALLASLFIPRAWLSGLSEETALFAFWGLSNWRLQSNTDFYFAPRAEFNPYTQTWSLGVEEQFYLLAPILFFFWFHAHQQGKGTLRKGSLILFGSLASFSLVLCAWATPHDPALAFYFIGARFWELACGALLFLITVMRQTDPKAPVLPKMWGALVPWAGILAILLALVFTQTSTFPWPWALLTCLGTLCILGGFGANTAHPVRHFLAHPFLVWLGRRSYSLYLWHWPIFVLLRWTSGLETPMQYVSALILTLLLAMLTYRFVETPLRHNGWIERRAHGLVIIFFLLMPLAGTVTSYYFFIHLERLSLSSVSRNPSDWYGSNLSIYTQGVARPCTVEQEFAPFAGGMERILRPKHCEPSPSTLSTQTSTLYVLGDSHAGAIIPLLEQTSATLGITVRIFSFQGTIATPYACSYLNLQAPMDVGRAPGCLPFNEAVRERIHSQAKPGDLVLLASLRMPRYGDQWASFGIDNMQAKIDSAEARRLRQAAAEQIPDWLSPLLRDGVHVAFMAPTPVFQAPTFRCADWFNANNPICIGKNQQAKIELERLRQPIVLTMQEQAKNNPAVLVWDPFAVLCPESSCQAVRDGRPLFFDGDHLSNYGNWIIYPHFLNWLRQNRLYQ